MKKAVNRIIPRTRKLGSSVVKKLDINSILDFYILLDDPHKVYNPGDQIKGEIFLILNRNLLNVTIDLSLIGNIKVKNSISTSSFRTKKKTLFNHVIRIYPGLEQQEHEEDGSDEYDYLRNGLTKGQHIFPFIAQLSKENIFTSISFEKGSIGYKLRASIGDTNNTEDEAPLFTCEKLLNVVKPINVAALPVPKVKTLIVKYPTKRLKKTMSQTSTTNSSAISVMSLDTASNNVNTAATLPSPDSPMVSNGVDKSRIKLSVELLNLGYLRGELIPVKISLQHIKRVKNLNGIIITLIRICKVDFGPDGPIQSFRKDLSQTIAPLFVDPVTFKAEINSSLRIPADAFPTIMGNEVVTFQYSIEVIVNLSNSKSMNNNFQEKVQDDEDLNGVLTHNNNTATTNGVAVTGGVSTSSQSLSNGNSPTEYFNNGVSNQVVPTNIFNVDKLKRMKNVLTLNTEVIIGTKRRERRSRLQRRYRNQQALDGGAVSVSESSATAQSTPRSNDSSYVQPPPIERYPLSVGSSPNDAASSLNDVQHLPDPSMELSTPTPSVTRQEPPPLPQFDNLTEKQILQLRETSLLPSEPAYNNTNNNNNNNNNNTYENASLSTINAPAGGSSGHIQQAGMSSVGEPVLSPHSSSDLIDYVPMYEEYDKSYHHHHQPPPLPPQETEASNEDEDDLYTRSKLVTQIEGINVDVTEDPLRLETVNE